MSLLYVSINPRFSISSEVHYVGFFMGIEKFLAIFLLEVLGRTHERSPLPNITFHFRVSDTNTLFSQGNVREYPDQETNISSLILAYQFSH